MLKKSAYSPGFYESGHTMLEATVLLGKAAILALPAGWLVAGAYDNIRQPHINHALIHAVLTMRDVELEYPQYWPECRKRAITHAGVIKALFWAIVTCEVFVSAWMVFAVGLMAAAGFGWGDPTTALVHAVASIAAFTAIWGAFLVGGNLFHYWMPERNPQKTHYFMTLWGVGTFVAMLA